MKVAYQAGVLQVWLDEARLPFNMYDAASGGVFNLAMLCQGRSGTEIADAWRTLKPLQAVSLNWQLVKLFWAESPFTLKRFRRNVLRRAWGLDWTAIRNSELDATFDVYDFTDQEMRGLQPSAMSEDMLIACVSLPGIFPAVRQDGHVYVDAVYATDADVIGAVRRGADEIYIIWTVSRNGRWRSGPVNHYFQIVEQSANANLKASLARIRESNAQLAKGELAEFGRPIAIKELYAPEVPVHYIFVFRAKHLREAVELGIREAREWCKREGVSLEPESAP
jgi:predicted acylesterase/phospholipase RssA